MMNEEKSRLDYEMRSAREAEAALDAIDALVPAQRKMPVQKPGRSIQTYATPPEFIAAVKRRFKIDAFSYDLAAEIETAKAEFFFCKEENALVQDWTKLSGPLWLNPPYADISPWAEKCSLSTVTSGRSIFFLVPASIGANWFADYVHGRALVLAVQGRMSFDGKAPYPKDVVLCLYGPEAFGYQAGFNVWDWRKS